MPYSASIGTYLPCWGSAALRVPGDDEDAITLAVVAGRAALVPGLKTPYALVIVELDEVGVRALVKVTGAEPDTVNIGDRGRLLLRRVALRSGVPDYGYAFQPETEAA